MSFDVNLDTLPDPDLTDNARRVLDARYLIRDEEGNPTETPKDMFWRVASRIAEEELNYEASPYEARSLAIEFYLMMSQGYWLPNSPTLTGAGRELGMLSACFVLPVTDTIENGDDGIYDTLMDAARIFQAGGGVGYDFSRLRPSGAMVQSTTGVASGPVTFMEIYDASVNVIEQGGHRRGAQMGILRVDHPDVRDFVHAKADLDRLTNFNISVAVTDDFMERVLASDGEVEPQPLVDPRDGSKVGEVDAAELFDEIVEQAHATGEPGLFFVDRANEANPVPHLGDIRATNPCGEVPLPPYGVCNLGSINLSKFVEDGEMQWDDMRHVVHQSMRFLDNVIDANNYPLPEIRERSDKTRRVGNGVMGLADALIAMDLPYDSEEGRAAAEEMAERFHEWCIEASEELAEERGPFPAWEESEFEGTPRRNAYVNCVAPTGTISIIAGCSGGIEPIYNVAFTRHQADMEMTENHRMLPDWAKKDTPAATREAVEDDPNLSRIFRTAHDISPKDHVLMQAVWQDHIEQAVSKTINLPEDAGPEDVRAVYTLAYELGCKGITVYRTGSRSGQALSADDGEEDADDSATGIKQERPAELTGVTKRQQTPLGRAYVTINEHDGRPFEVFVNLGKAGASVNADAEAIGRLISLALRHGVPVDEIHEQLLGISSDRAIGIGPDTVHSLPDGVAHALGEYLGEENGVERTMGRTCPNCQTQMGVDGNCETCPSCGHSECG